MSPGQPWWYSGDEATGAESSSDQAPADPRVDVSALAQGAQRLIEWATERVVAPHAEHADPTQHPDCLMCRAAQLMGPTGPASSSAGQSGSRPAAEPITWLTVVDERPAGPRHP